MKITWECGTVFIVLKEGYLQGITTIESGCSSA